MQQVIVTIAAVIAMLAASQLAEADSVSTPAVSVNPTVRNGVVCPVHNLLTREITVAVKIVIATEAVACTYSLLIAEGGADAVPCNPTNFLSVLT